MGSRRESPDILAQLMEGNNKTIEQESNKTINQSEENATPQELDAAIKQENGIAILGENNKAIKHDSGKTHEPSKEKTTFNLSVSTLDKLENTWISLRRKLRDKGRVTKTLIVEKAIELAIQDLERNGEASALYQDIAKQ